MRRFMFLFAVLFAFVALTAEEAPAADASAEAPAEAAAPAKDPHHFIYFKPKLAVSFINNRYVVGKTDGIYFQTDLDVLFNYKYKKEIHEVLTDLNIKEGLSYTPMFDGFVIASDLMKFDLRYNLMFHKQAGWYVKGGLETHFFPGYDYRNEDTTYRVNGTKKNGATRKFKLTPSGQPLYLTEGTGVFYRPIEKEYANLELSLGLASRQVLVGDSLIVDGDADDGLREVSEMTDIFDAGGEFMLTFKGTAEQKKIGYDLMARLLMPFYYKDREEAGLSWGDVLQFETKVRIDFNVNKYIAFNYEFDLKRDFAVVKEWQMTNGLYLTIFYELDKQM